MGGIPLAEPEAGMSTFLNSLLLALGLCLAGGLIYWLLNYREKPDASNPEHDTTNWEHIPEDWK